MRRRRLFTAAAEGFRASRGIESTGTKTRTMKTNTGMMTITSTRHLFGTGRFLCSLLCLVATYCGIQAHAQTLSPAIQDEFIVVLKPTALGEEVAQQHGLVARHHYKHALNGFAGHIPKGRLKALRNDPRVEFIEQDTEVQALGQIVPTGIRRIGASPLQSQWHGCN